MNSVTQRKVKSINSKKEGAGKELFVLFCCTLLVLFQLFTFFVFPQNVTPNKAELQITAGHKLILDATQQVALEIDTTHVQTVKNHYFAPFFFFPVAINYCDKFLLMSVKGIGPGLAERILMTRKHIGSFSSPEDLLMVQGIGPVRLQKFTPSFSFTQNHE